MYVHTYTSSGVCVCVCTVAKLVPVGTALIFRSAAKFNVLSLGALKKGAFLLLSGFEATTHLFYH